MNPVLSLFLSRPFSSNTNPIFGIGKFPLNRRLTRLSIPLGFRQLSPTRMKRSDWKRVKRFVRFLTMGVWLIGVGI